MESLLVYCRNPLYLGLTAKHAQQMHTRAGALGFELKDYVLEMHRKNAEIDRNFGIIKK